MGAVSAARDAEERLGVEAEVVYGAAVEAEGFSGDSDGLPLPSERHILPRRRPNPKH